MAYIEIQGLSKAYQQGGQEICVLKQLDLSIAKGEFVALLGSSGCGKTTLLNLLAAIDGADSGHIQVDGQALEQLSEKQRTLFRRHHIGFVFQFFNLIPTLTVAENLLFPLQLIAQKNASERVIQLLAAVGLAHKATTYPEHLSGGEQQRIAIARALIHQPKLLLADEPTGNLDEENGERIMDLLCQLANEHQMTVLLVTHSEQVAKRSDRIIRLANGQIVS